MSGRGKIGVRLFTSDCDDHDVLPENLTDFIGWLNGLLLSAPEEHRAAIKIDLESEYESSGVGVDVYYYRDETDDEMAKRIAHEAAAIARRRNADEAREREVYEALKRKFG